jgi:hypothetical protein
MNHLSQAELVDLIEESPALPPARVQHFETCARCRAEGEALRAALGLAAADDVPAPSPLFWDHFSTRVSEAVRRETPPTGTLGNMRWLRRPLAPWATAGTVTVLAILTIVWRATVYAPVPVVVPSTVATDDPLRTVASIESTAASLERDLNMDDDEAWAVVRAAADDLRWEEAHAAGLSAGPDAVEGLALELTAEERLELGRLLGAELKRNGV